MLLVSQEDARGLIADGATAILSVAVSAVGSSKAGSAHPGLSRIQSQVIDQLTLILSARRQEPLFYGPPAGPPSTGSAPSADAPGLPGRRT